MEDIYTIYKINDTIIRSVEDLRDLGLQTDSKLSLRIHCQKIRAKCLKLVGLMYRVFYGSDPLIYLTYYKTCILPLIDYSAVLYVLVSRSNIVLVEGIQRKFTKRLHKRVFPYAIIPSYELRLKKFNLVTLESRYRSQDLIFLYKIIKLMIPISTIHINMSSRHKYLIIVPPINTSCFRSSFFHRASIYWNRTVHRDFESLPAFKHYLSYAISS